MSHNDSEQQDEVCVKCDTVEQLFISLDCGHNYCLVCMSFLSLKGKTDSLPDSQVTCVICHQTTSLDQQSLEAIKTTIQQKIVPEFNDTIEQEVSAQNINEDNYERVRTTLNELKIANLNEQKPKSNNLKSGKNQLKRYSEQPSFDHLTPSTKYFFSKCDSPVNRHKPAKEQCSMHPFEELTFVCLCCENELLCLKCVMGSKHKTHNIKNIDKGIQQLCQQLAMKKLEVSEKIEYLEMWERRLHDKKQIIHERWNRNKQNIHGSFQQIFSKLKKKQQELILQCDNHFLKSQNTIINELNNLQNNLSRLNHFKNDFKKMEHPQREKPTIFFGFYNKVKTSLGEALMEDYEPGLALSREISINLNEEQLTSVIQNINKINLITSHKATNHATRLPTNFTSVNSSRDKKHKKYAKTQEDEGTLLHCGLNRKTEANFQTAEKMTKKKNINTSTKTSNKDLPIYVTKFYDKQNKLQDKGNSQNVKLNSSKMGSSKILSKTIVLEDVKKKKEPLLESKFKERKPIINNNPLESLKTQKNIFETKKKKIII